MSRKVFSVLLLILITTAFVAPLTSSVTVFSRPVYDINGSEIPQISFKHRLYMDTKLRTHNSTIEFSDMLENTLSKGFNNTGHGNFTLDLDENKLDLKEVLRGEIKYYNKTLDLPNTEFSIKTNSQIYGGNNRIQGDIRVNGTLNVTVEAQAVEISFDMPMIINGTYNEKTNTSIILMNTKNAYMVFKGEKIRIEYSIKQITNFSNQTATIKTDFKAYSKNQLVLLMLAQLLSTIFGVSIQPPVYDPSLGEYVISYSNTKTYRIETTYQLIEYSLNAESLEARLEADINGTGKDHLLVIDFKTNGNVYSRGDFKKGVPIDKKGLTRIRELSMIGEIILDKNKIVIKIEGYGEYYSINLYAVQFTYRSIVPELLNKSIAIEGSKAVIEGCDEIKLMLNNKLYSKLIFTPDNASLAKNMYIVVNGTVLEANTLDDKVLIYKAVEQTKEIRAHVMSEKTERIIVEAQKANRVIIDAKNTALNGKVIESIFGKHDKVEIILPNTTNPIKGEILTYIISKPPKQLPKNTINISKIYDVTPTLNRQTKIKVKLYFDPKNMPENTKILVAHYVNSEWQIINPDTINKEEGYVEVTLTKFSPLVVIAKTTPQTTTTTTTTTTTITTTATTTTTTVIQTTTQTATSLTKTTTTTETTTRTTTPYKTTTIQTTTTPTQTTTQETTMPFTTTPSTTQPSAEINTTLVGAIIAIVIIGLVFLLVWRRK